MKDRPRRTLKVKSPPVLLVITKIKKTQKSNRNCNKGSKQKKIKPQIQTPPRKQKAEETQQSGGSELVAEMILPQRVIDLAPRRQQTPSQTIKQSKPCGLQRKRMERQLQRKQRLYIMGKRKDQTSNTMFNSILEYFS